VCRIFQRSKAQIRRYRKAGLADYGGRPVMFDRLEVQEFLKKRRKAPCQDQITAHASGLTDSASIISTGPKMDAQSAFQRGREIFRKLNKFSPGSS